MTRPRHKKVQQPQDSPADAPARLQADHVQDRPYFIEVGAGKHKRTVPASGKAYRRASVLQKAKLGRQLVDKSKCLDRDSTKDEELKAEQRYASGKRFTEAWLMANAGNWASGSDLTRVRVSGVPGSFADHAISEKIFLEEIRKKIGVNDWMIVRRVCGENCQIAEVVAEISPSYRYSTLARFREALDALDGAIGR